MKQTFRGLRALQKMIVKEGKTRKIVKDQLIDAPRSVKAMRLKNKTVS